MSGAPDSVEMTAALSVLRPIDVPIEDVISFRGTLGRGSFGLVKLGRLRSSKKKVAVKVIKKSSVTSRRQLHQLCREVQTLSSLRHEAIISYYGVVDNPDNLYLLLEYASGGELFDYIVKRGKLSEEDAAKCFRDMVRAVLYIHARNIVHRDIKPENFLLTKSGRVKLSDFGFCNTQQDGRFVVTPCGSPTYAAPEIYRNQPYDLTVDTWSLGICLYVMVTGCSPWGATNSNMLDEGVRRRLLSGDYVPLPSSVSRDCADLIRSMVQAKADDRLPLDAVEKHPWMRRHESTDESKDKDKDKDKDKEREKKGGKTERAGESSGNGGRPESSASMASTVGSSIASTSRSSIANAQASSSSNSPGGAGARRGLRSRERPRPPSSSSRTTTSGSSRPGTPSAESIKEDNSKEWTKFSRDLSDRMEKVQGGGNAGIRPSGTVERVQAETVSSVLTMSREESEVRARREERQARHEAQAAGYDESQRHNQGHNQADDAVPKGSRTHRRQSLSRGSSRSGTMSPVPPPEISPNRVSSPRAVGRKLSASEIATRPRTFVRSSSVDVDQFGTDTRGTPSPRHRGAPKLAPIGEADSSQRGPEQF